MQHFLFNFTAQNQPGQLITKLILLYFLGYDYQHFLNLFLAYYVNENFNYSYYGKQQSDF
jgi:hypothetical protein